MLVRGVHVQESPFMQRSINHTKNLFSESIRVTNLKCMLTPTNSIITIANHVFSQGMYGIDEMGVQYIYI